MPENKPLRVQYLSDIHSEFGTKIPEFIGDVVILAGDIAVGHAAFPVLEERMKTFKGEAVFYIPGNHEYWEQWPMEFESKFIDNCNKLNIIPGINGGKIIKGWVFIASTLWSSTVGYNPLEEAKFLANARNLPDFNQIKGFTPLAMAKKNRDAINYVSLYLYTPAKAVATIKGTVIATHHCPRPECNPSPSDWISPLFYNRGISDKLINNCDYWIYGHNHRNMDPFKISGLKPTFLTNQHGYPGEPTGGFDPEAVINLPGD